MPDTTGPSQGGTSSNRPLNVNEATVGNVKVTRLDVNTGEIKELHTDLLQEICDCIERQTVELGVAMLDETRDLVRELQTMRRTLVKELKKGGGGRGGRGGGAGGGGAGGGRGGGDDATAIENAFAKGAQTISEAIKVSMLQASADIGGEGGGGIPGVDVAQVRANERSLRALSEVIDRNLLPNFSDMNQIIRQGFNIQFQQNLDRVNNELLNFTQRLTDVWAQMGNLKTAALDVYEQMDLIAKTGTANLLDFIDDVFAGRMGLIETFNLVREAADQDMILPLGILGSNLNEVAENLGKFETDIERFDFDFAGAFRNLEEMRSAQVALLDAQKRGDRMADISSIQTQRNVAEQLKQLKTISGFTGKTVDELIKASAQDRKTFNELAASGLMSQQEADTIAANMQHLPKELQDLFKDVFQFGTGRENVALAISQNQELATQFGPFMNEIAAAADVMASSNDPIAVRRAISEGLGESFRVQAAGQGVAATIEGAQRGFGVRGALNILGDPEQLQKVLDDQNKRAQAPTAGLDEAITELRTWFAENLPSSIGGLITAIGLNIVALAANTAALFGRLGFGGRGGFFGGRRPAQTRQSRAARRARRAANPERTQRARERLRRMRARGGPGGPGGGPGGGGSRLGNVARGAGRLGGRALGFLGPAGAIAGAGMLGWEVGGLINQGVEAATGGSIGTGLFNMFGGDQMPESGPGSQAWIDEQNKKAAERRAANKKKKEQAAAAQTKVVTPTTATEATGVEAPAGAPSADPAIAQMMAQTEKLTSIEALLLTANGLHTQIRDTIGVAGAVSRAGDVTGPSPVQRKVPTMEGDPSLFEGSVSVDAPNRVSR